VVRTAGVCTTKTNAPWGGPRFGRTGAPPRKHITVPAGCLDRAPRSLSGKLNRHQQRAVYGTQGGGGSLSAEKKTERNRKKSPSLVKGAPLGVSGGKVGKTGRTQTLHSGGGPDRCRGGRGIVVKRRKGGQAGQLRITAGRGPNSLVTDRLVGDKKKRRGWTNFGGPPRRGTREKRRRGHRADLSGGWGRGWSSRSDSGRVFAKPGSKTGTRPDCDLRHNPGRWAPGVPSGDIVERQQFFPRLVRTARWTQRGGGGARAYLGTIGIGIGCSCSRFCFPSLIGPRSGAERAGRESRDNVQHRHGREVLYFFLGRCGGFVSPQLRVPGRTRIGAGGAAVRW